MAERACLAEGRAQGVPFSQTNLAEARLLHEQPPGSPIRTTRHQRRRSLLSGRKRPVPTSADAYFRPHNGRTKPLIPDNRTRCALATSNHASATSVRTLRELLLSSPPFIQHPFCLLRSHCLAEVITLAILATFVGEMSQNNRGFDALRHSGQPETPRETKNGIHNFLGLSGSAKGNLGPFGARSRGVALPT
jgi:hypothetical protein